MPDLEANCKRRTPKSVDQSTRYLSSQNYSELSLLIHHLLNNRMRL